MELRQFVTPDGPEVVTVFADTFTASEGEEEGRVIRKLTQDLVDAEDGQQVFGFVAVDQQQLAGGIFFSSVSYADRDPIWLLAPVAVHPEFQGSGVGSRLIRHGLDELRSQSKVITITYGDPSYYKRFGYEPITESLIAAPHPLSLPHGWLGQTLDGSALPRITERGQCVPGFDHPEYW